MSNTSYDLTKLTNPRGYRRICFYGGPGSGKSEVSSWIYSKMKETLIESKSDLHVESVKEYVKTWAYQKVPIEHFDQVYIFGKQMRIVELPLRNKVDLVVTDSPMLLQVCFSKRNGLNYSESLESIAMSFEKQYPGLHIFVDRGEREYYPEGRYEDESGARRMDKLVKTHVPEMLGSTGELVQFRYDEKQEMLDYVMRMIAEN